MGGKKKKRLLFLLTVNILSEESLSIILSLIFPPTHFFTTSKNCSEQCKEGGRSTGPVAAASSRADLGPVVVHSLHWQAADGATA